MLHTYFCLLLASGRIWPHVAKWLPETRRNKGKFISYDKGEWRY